MNNSSGQSDSVILVIFGITGDLSGRYLLPALTHMLHSGSLGDETRIIGVSRREVSLDNLFDQFRSSLKESSSTITEDQVDQLKSVTTMLTMDLNNPADYEQLGAEINGLEKKAGECLKRLFYLSIPPDAYGQIVDNIGKTNLNLGCTTHNNSALLLVEKPFGHDLESAKELLSRTGRVFEESQTYRIDHFLAKQGVQDFFNFRKKYAQELADYWSGDKIKDIEIYASEQIDIEGRVKFYEPLGALKDFVQNHLIQVLALSGMNADVNDLANAKAKFLESVLPVETTKPNTNTRGQYEGYREEVANPESFTETYAEISVTSNDPEWQSTRFRLWSGKALDHKEYAVKVSFNDGSRLKYRIQPDQKLICDGDPGTSGSAIKSLVEEFNNYLAESASSLSPNAYETVIKQAINSDHSIFASNQDVLESWRIIEPVVKLWSQNSDGLIIYKKGESGPLNSV